MTLFIISLILYVFKSVKNQKVTSRDQKVTSQDQKVTLVNQKVTTRSVFL